MTRRPIGIDLFAGVGGFSLGFEQAGFDVAAAIEIDPIHCASHSYNFPYTKVIPRSVVGLSGETIRQLSGIGSQDVDVVFGGAPCQGFSMIGQRAIDDPRNVLVKEFVRAVADLEADYFVFENVKGLTLGQQRRFLDEIMDRFEERGYDVVRSYSVLNAADYGVPQDRRRLFLLGAKQGLQLPDYPRERTVPAGSRLESLDLPLGPSCLDALGDLPNAEDFEELLDSDEATTIAWRNPGRYASELRALGNNAWRSGYPRQWDTNRLTASMRTSHTEISRRRFAETDGGKVEPISRFFKLPREGVSNTLRAGTDSARGAFTSPRPIHYEFDRCVTVREMARLHGYPDWFRFHRTKWHGARQIGNSVPPPLVNAVAERILAATGLYPTHPEHALELGNPDLLRLDMKAASELFGVPVPIGRRDKKSGAKKRKQEEIEALRISL